MQELGPLRSVELLARKDEEQGRGYRYRFQYEGDTMIASLVIGKDGQVGRFSFQAE